MPRSNMVHQFAQVPRADIPRSSFDRSHGLKTTFDAGYLVPIFWDEALPGDTLNVNMTGFARLATPIKPVMDNMFLETFFFAVPMRLIWENWQRFNGEQDNPGDSIDYLCPQVNTPAGGWTSGSLGDYFGLPTEVDGLLPNAFFFRAYNLIFNEWFRDENLIDSVPVPKDDGPDDPSDYVLLRRGKRHDYFTSALPFPQKGDSVELPLGVSAPVIPRTQGAAPQFLTDNEQPFLIGLGTPDAQWDRAAQGLAKWLDPGLSADLSEATAATINQLRQSFQIQRLLERDARGGSRYTEIVRAHFGVVSPDARLQRPEYLGGGRSYVNINPVAQTGASVIDGSGAAGEVANTAQGNLAAFGTASLMKHGFAKSFTEHCVVIGLVNCRADLTYQQGLERHWSRRTRYDFYWPALSRIGEQAVVSREIYADGTTGDTDIWGYQERYAEYRFKPSRITGKFRSSDPQSLDVWHLAQDFGNRPVLGKTFIEDNPPIDRIIAVQSEPHFLYDAHFNYRCARPMPLYGVPGLIDHF